MGSGVCHFFRPLILKRQICLSWWYERCNSQDPVPMYKEPKTGGKTKKQKQKQSFFSIRQSAHYYNNLRSNHKISDIKPTTLSWSQPQTPLPKLQHILRSIQFFSEHPFGPSKDGQSHWQLFMLGHMRISLYIRILPKAFWNEPNPFPKFSTWTMNK